MLNLKTVEASVSIAQTSSVAAVHESAIDVVDGARFRRRIAVR
jgi:hypothetical protein